MFKKIILLFISFIFISYTVFAVADQKYLIDELVKQRYHKKISEDIQLEDNYIGTLNKKGILLKEYYISDLGDKQLPQILSFQVPFVAVKNGTFLLIEKIEINGQRKFVKAKNEYGDIEKIEWKKFINGWDGKIIAPPLVRVFLKRKAKKDENSSFVIFYVAHVGAFKRIENSLEYFLRKHKGDLVYVDELGLIPEESIENLMQVYNVSKRKAFNKAKDSFQSGLDNISKGIPDYSQNGFYNQLYKKLAEYKVESVLENLDFGLWEDIVNFDEMKFSKHHLKALEKGKIQLAINEVSGYQNNFWRLNVVRRDQKFVNQLVKLKEENPGKIIFTIRGIEHMGMEEELVKQGYNVKVYNTLRKSIFQEMELKSRILIYRRMGVDLPNSEEKGIWLFAPFEQILIIYFMTEGYTYEFSNILAKSNLSVLKNKNDVLKVVHRLKQEIGGKSILDIKTTKLAELLVKLLKNM